MLLTLTAVQLVLLGEVEVRDTSTLSARGWEKFNPIHTFVNILQLAVFSQWPTEKRQLCSGPLLVKIYLLASEWLSQRNYL